MHEGDRGCLDKAFDNDKKGGENSLHGIMLSQQSGISSAYYAAAGQMGI
jgi:hypothetical protein